MLKIEKNINKIKKSNLFYLIEKKSDIKILEDLGIEWLELNPNILSKIKEILKEWKNNFLEFYLWDNIFEKLIIIFFLDDSKQDLVYFASNIFRDFKQNNLTICSNNDENLFKLLDLSILSRYKFTKYKRYRFFNRKIRK